MTIPTIDYRQMLQKATKFDYNSILKDSINQISSILSTNAISSEQFDIVEETKKAKKKKEEEEKAIKEIEEANNKINSSLSSLGKPLTDAFKTMRNVPSRLMSVLDTFGSSSGMYSNMDKMKEKTDKIVNTFVEEEEVPITYQDYKANPRDYPKLVELEMKQFYINDLDCLSSGYTKKNIKINSKITDKITQFFQKPTDDDFVSKKMEKVIGTTIKKQWEQTKPIVDSIAAVCPIPPIKGMIDAVLSSFEGIVTIATTTVSEEKLDEYIQKRKEQQVKEQAEAEKTEKSEIAIGKSLKDTCQKQIEQSQNTIDESKKKPESPKGNFENEEAPKIAEEDKEVIEELKDCMQFVKDFLVNIYVNIILTIVSKIVEVLAKIFETLGLGKLPEPLGSIAELIQNMASLIEFIIGLPMSLINAVKAIYTRKSKMLQISSTPIPTQPLKELISLPSTSEDLEDNNSEQISGEISSDFMNSFKSILDNDYLKTLKDFVGTSKNIV